LPYLPGGAERSITLDYLVYDHAEHDTKIGGLISIVGGELTTWGNLSRLRDGRGLQKAL
jgi:hypothetical protein